MSLYTNRPNHFKIRKPQLNFSAVHLDEAHVADDSWCEKLCDSGTFLNELSGLLVSNDQLMQADVALETSFLRLS